MSSTEKLKLWNTLNPSKLSTQKVEEVCTVHKKPEEKPATNTTTNNTITNKIENKTNTTTKNNTITNSATKNTAVDETTE